MNKKQIVINIVVNVLSFAIGLSISFFLSPYIIENLGVDAYGFFQTANIFFSYATILTIAINSMAGRFISVAYHRGDKLKAEQYFNTVYLANIVLVSALFIVSIFVVVFLDRIIQIPSDMVRDVKILFLLIFISSLFVVMMSAHKNSMFVKNRVDISAYISIFKVMLRGALLLILFALFRPSLIIIGVTSFAMMMTEGLAYALTKRKIMPEIRVDIRLFKWEMLKDLVGSGKWNVLNNINGLLTLGLDLLFANIFLGPVAAGVLAVARTFPNYTVQMFDIFKRSYLPSITKGYAEDEKSLLKNFLASFIPITMAGSIIIGGILSFGDIFYGLWIPSQDAKFLQLLTTLIVMVEFSFYSVRTLPGLFQIKKRLKRFSVSTFGMAILSVAIVIAVLRTTQNTDLGLIAIAGVTSVLTNLLNLFYIYPLAAKVIGEKWTAFFPPVLKGYACLAVVTVLGYGLRQIWAIDSWGRLALSAIFVALIGFGINLFILLNKDKRQNLWISLNGYIKTKFAK
ncbi:MAG: hypothetical protein AB1Z19_06095 [Eubacteriales bacterium]